MPSALPPLCIACSIAHAQRQAAARRAADVQAALEEEREAGGALRAELERLRAALLEKDVAARRAMARLEATEHHASERVRVLTHELARAAGTSVVPRCAASRACVTGCPSGVGGAPRH